jgi:hypothetical protein
MYSLLSTALKPNLQRHAFELMAEQSRPDEYLQCYLDLLRVLYEPCPPGSMLLNSNWDLLYEAVPTATFELGYLSVLGTPGASIDQVIGDSKRQAAKNGYDLVTPHAVFPCICVGAWVQSGLLLDEVREAWGGGFLPDDVLNVISNTADGLSPAEMTPISHAGVCLDKNLAENQVRLSVLMFLPVKGGDS